MDLISRSRFRANNSFDFLSEAVSKPSIKLGSNFCEARLACDFSSKLLVYVFAWSHFKGYWILSTTQLHLVF